MKERLFQLVLGPVYSNEYNYIFQATMSKIQGSKED